MPEIKDSQKSSNVFGKVVFNKDYIDHQCESKIYEGFKRLPKVKVLNEVETTISILKSNPLVWEACHDKTILDAFFANVSKNYNELHYQFSESVAKQRNFTLSFYDFFGYLDIATLFNIQNFENHEAALRIRIEYNLYLLMGRFHPSFNSHEAIMRQIKQHTGWKEEYSVHCREDLSLFEKYPLIMQYFYYDWVIKDLLIKSISRIDSFVAKQNVIDKFMEQLSDSISDHSFKFVWIFLSNHYIPGVNFIDKMWDIIVVKNNQHDLETLNFIFEITQAFYPSNPDFFQQKAVRVFAKIIQDPFFQESLSPHAKPLFEKLMSLLPYDDGRSEIPLKYIDASEHAFAVIVETMKVHGDCSDNQVHLLSQLLSSMQVCQNSIDTMKVQAQVSQLMIQKFREDLKKCLSLCGEPTNKKELPSIKKTMKLGWFYQAAIDKKVAEVLNSTFQKRKTNF